MNRAFDWPFPWKHIPDHGIREAKYNTEVALPLRKQRSELKSAEAVTGGVGCKRRRNHVENGP